MSDFLGGRGKTDETSLKTDEEVLSLSLSDPSYFEEIVKRYEDAFISKSQSIIGDREEAMDIVQEVFTKIYINAKKFKKVEGAKFSSWAYKILINTTFSHYQKLKKNRERFTKIDTEIMESMPTKPEDDILSEKHYLEEEILVVFSRMPKSLSKILRMYFIEGYSQKAIAEKEGITVSAVKTRVYRAKKIFKKESIKPFNSSYK
jgi:RNA polymerase sigma-70 factor (ECF subfamily)